MAGPFDAVHAQIEKDFPTEQDSSPESNQEKQTEGALDTSAEPTAKEAAQAIADLNQFQKVKFEGQEWTLDDLKKAVMRQKDYTQKTQAIAEERKTYEADKADRKYYENLSFDLAKVQNNPALAQEFIKTYPEKFHSYLKDALANNSSQMQSQPASTPQIPVELMSQVQRLQSFVEKQEVAKAETEIEGLLSKALSSHKYANRKEVLADAFELHNRGTKLTSELWNQLAEESHNNRKAEFDGYYKELVQQQTKANAKARDVGPGGGIPGQAPKKYKNFGDLNKDVLASMTKPR